MKAAPLHYWVHRRAKCAHASTRAENDSDNNDAARTARTSSFGAIGSFNIHWCDTCIGICYDMLTPEVTSFIALLVGECIQWGVHDKMGTSAIVPTAARRMRQANWTAFMVSGMTMLQSWPRMVGNSTPRKNSTIVEGVWRWYRRSNENLNVEWVKCTQYCTSLLPLNQAFVFWGIFYHSIGEFIVFSTVLLAFR